MWVTVEYIHPSSSAKVRYTKRTQDLKPYEWRMGFRAANELEVLAAEQASQTVPAVPDWRDKDNVQWLLEYDPLKLLEGT